MIRKRPITTIACLLLAGVTLVACSKGSESAANVPAPVANKDIRILLSHSSAAFAAKASQGDQDKYVSELNKLSGYKTNYEFLGHDADYIQQLTLRFASGELGDLVRTDSINSTIHQGAVDQNVFLDLGPLLDKYGANIKKNIPAVAWNSPKVTKGGKIYGIPVLSGAPADRIMFIRQDWLDKLKMDVPKTLDDFLKFAQGVKENDMNGDGDPNNEWALSITDNLWFNDVFSGSFGVRPDVWNVRDGKLEPDIIQPEMKQAIAFYKKLYDNGYIEKDFITKKQPARGADINKGLVGAWGATTYQYMRAAKKENFINQPDAKLTMMVPPKGPKGQNYMQPQDDQIYFVWVIPAKTKNPEEVIKFLDWTWSSPDADRFFTYGIEGFNYTVDSGKVNFNSDSERNAGPMIERQFFQLSLNTRENGLNSIKVTQSQPNSEYILQGYKLAESVMAPNDALYMPQLEALKGHPELDIGLRLPNSLFYDAFVKLVVGKEDLDKGFDAFVQDWKKRGGDAAIKEATDWYNKFNKK
jgi:putative aldouronate transport system substrate-binding protein